MDLANMGDMFSNMFGNRKQTNNQRPVHTSNITVNIGVLDSYRANKHTLSYRRQVMCEPCNGGGGDKTTCNTCGGSGNVVKTNGVRNVRSVNTDGL